MSNDKPLFIATLKAFTLATKFSEVQNFTPKPIKINPRKTTRLAILGVKENTSQHLKFRFFQRTGYTFCNSKVLS